MLSDEREKKIRSWLYLEGNIRGDMTYDLLGEIDRLRIYSKGLEEITQIDCKELGQLKEENQRLKTELNYTENQRAGNRDSLERCRHERDSVKAENADLKETVLSLKAQNNIFLKRDILAEMYVDLITENQKLKAENQRVQDNRNTWKKDAGHWYDENQRLKDENEKLRAELENCPSQFAFDAQVGFAMQCQKENQRLRERIEKLIEAILWASPCGQNWITPEQHPSYETIGKVMREAIAQDKEAAK